MAELATLKEPREEQSDEGLGEMLEHAPEDAHEERAAPAATCVYCGEGLVRGDVPRFGRGFGIVVLVTGLLLSVFVLLLGLPVVVIGAYLAIATRPVWTCRECGALVDRHAS